MVTPIYTTPNEYAPYYRSVGHPPSSDAGDHPTHLKIDPDNQICTASGLIRVRELQRELADHELCLPLPLGDWPHDNLQLRQAIDLNLPHPAEALHGSWRDWIIGMSVVLGDGLVAKSGSEAVKSVAGYDAHKLFIGARGTLGIIESVILRVKPKTARLAPTLISGSASAEYPIIHRVLPSDFDSALRTEDLIFAHRETATIWRTSRPSRFPHDWVLVPHEAPELSPVERVYYERAKALFDPDGRLNPGLL